MKKDLFAAERELTVKSFDDAMDAVRGDFHVAHYGDHVRNLSFTEGGLLESAAGTYPVTRNAFEGLCRSVNIPSDFGRRIPQDLFIHNFDTLKAKLKRRVHICISRETIISVNEITTDPIRNMEILKEASQRAERTGMKLHDVRLSDRGMQINLLDPRRNMEPVKGDITSVGLVLVSSETGFLKTTASLFLIRLVCSNGATVKKAFNYQISSERCLHEFFDETEKTYFNYDTFSARYRRLTERELNAAELLALHGRLAGLVGTSQADNLSNMSRAHRIELKNRIENEGDRKHPTGINAYDFYNSITHAAKAFSFVTRIKLESLGGSLIHIIPTISNN